MRDLGGMNEDQWCPSTLSNREQHDRHQRYYLYPELPTPLGVGGYPYLLGSLQMAVLHVSTCQIDMKKLLDMMISYLVLDYDILS